MTNKPTVHILIYRYNIMALQNLRIPATWEMDAGSIASLRKDPM
jgi:hypothetical protein